MRSTTVTRRAETDHRSCSGGPAPGPRSMLPSRLCGSLPADPSLTPTGPHEPPSGQPRSPCFTLHPGANRLLLAPTDLMVGVLSACYTRRPQGVTHGQSRCTVLSVRRRVGRDPPQIPKLRMSTPLADRLWSTGGQTGGLPGQTEVATAARPWTSSTLRARPLRSPGHHGMEEVRGSSPLSSTAKVLVKGYLILRDPSVAYATEGHLWLAGADRSESAACNHHSLGVGRAANNCPRSLPPWSRWPRGQWHESARLHGRRPDLHRE
jgi:hypothetical protein